MLNVPRCIPACKATTLFGTIGKIGRSLKSVCLAKIPPLACGQTAPFDKLIITHIFVCEMKELL